MTDPFVVHVTTLRRNPGTSSHEERHGVVEMAGPLHEDGIDPGRSVVPEGAEAQVVVDVTAFSGGIEVKGTVSAPWTGICRRCATPVGGQLEIPVQERFAPGSANANEDELYPITDGTIDLQPLARDAIVLELPMAPLCREDCRGLCPQCGADLNEGECSCVAPRDARWANLDVLR
jgi:uncharacterized protein